jgi:hypothetical protein
LRIKMDAFFATPFKRFRRKKGVTWWSKIRGSLESVLKNKRFCFTGCSLWTLLVIHLSYIDLALASLIQPIIRFSWRVVFLSKLERTFSDIWSFRVWFIRHFIIKGSIGSRRVQEVSKIVKRTRVFLPRQKRALRIVLKCFYAIFGSNRPLISHF